MHGRIVLSDIFSNISEPITNQKIAITNSTYAIDAATCQAARLLNFTEAKLRLWSIEFIRCFHLVGTSKEAQAVTAVATLQAASGVWK